MLTDLEIIAQIDEKIHQLPVKFLLELNDYVDFLLKEQRHLAVNKVRKSAVEITDIVFQF